MFSLNLLNSVTKLERANSCVRGEGATADLSDSLNSLNFLFHLGKTPLTLICQESWIHHSALRIRCPMW